MPNMTQILIEHLVNRRPSQLCYCILIKILIGPTPRDTIGMSDLGICTLNEIKSKYIVHMVTHAVVYHQLWYITIKGCTKMTPSYAW